MAHFVRNAQRKMINKTRSIKTKDSYEASYYLLWGGRFVKVRMRQLYGKRREHKGYAKQWVIYLDNVPTWAVDAWRAGFGYGHIQTFVEKRKELKRLIKNN